MGDRESFNHMPYWVEFQQKQVELQPILIIVGTRSDLRNDRKVTIEEAEAFAAKHKALYIEISSKTGENFDKLEEMIGEAIFDKYYHVPNFLQISAPKEDKKKPVFWGLFG